MKNNTQDIAIVTFLNQGQIKKLGCLIENFKAEPGQNLYGVDGYIIGVYEEEGRYYSYTTGE